MDTQDFMDTLITWTGIYRQNRDPDLDYPASSDPDEAKWEENMLKIASVIIPVESLAGTPAFKKIEYARLMAKTKDRTKIKSVYLLFTEVEKYLKASLV